MWKELKLLRCLIRISMLLALCACNHWNKGNISIIEAEILILGSHPCVIIDNAQKLRIINIRKYRNGKLKEYSGCASEGLYTLNFEDEGVRYFNEDLPYKYLSLELHSDKVVFYKKRYLIHRRNKDTLFTKSEDNKYLILVSKDYFLINP